MKIVAVPLYIPGRTGMTIPREQNLEPAPPGAPLVQQHTEITA